MKIVTTNRMIMSSAVNPLLFQCGPGSGSRSGSKFLTIKHRKILRAENNSIFYSLKNCNLISLSLHEGLPSYRRSLQLSKENTLALQNMKFIHFFYFCVNFVLLDPDTDPADQNKKRILVDPDPQHRLFDTKMPKLKDRKEQIKSRQERMRSVKLIS